MRRTRSGYGGDPHWIVARYRQNCQHDGCGATVSAGSPGFYYPNSRRLYCKPCGEQAERELAAAVADEAFMNSQFA